MIEIAKPVPPFSWDWRLPSDENGVFDQGVTYFRIKVVTFLGLLGILLGFFLIAANLFALVWRLLFGRLTKRLRGTHEKTLTER